MSVSKERDLMIGSSAGIILGLVLIIMGASAEEPAIPGIVIGAALAIGFGVVLVINWLRANPTN